MFKKIAFAGALSALALVSVSANASFYGGLSANLMDSFKIEVKDSASSSKAEVENKKMNFALQGGYDFSAMALPLRVGLTLNMEKKEDVTIGANKNEFKKKLGFEIDTAYLLSAGPGKVALGGYLGNDTMSIDDSSAGKPEDQTLTTLGVKASYLFPVNDMIEVEGGMKMGVYSTEKKNGTTKTKVKSNMRVFAGVNFLF